MVKGYGEGGSQGRILVVDPDDWCREFLSQVIKLLGFPGFRLATTVDEAFAILEEISFDLLITDLNLVEFQRLLENCHRRFPSMRFILMAHRRTPFQPWAFQDRMEIVLKPLSLDEMTRKIREAVHYTHRIQVEEAFRRWKQEAFRLLG
ncbi:MAG: response regulator [Deltaproteobacteria bacterium]|nr:response regulator [Deltaproteobacteria bacterium]